MNILNSPVTAPSTRYGGGEDKDTFGGSKTPKAAVPGKKAVTFKKLNSRALSAARTTR